MRTHLLQIRIKLRIPRLSFPKNRFKSLLITQNCPLNLPSQDLPHQRNLNLPIIPINKNRKITDISWIVIRWDKRLRREWRNMGSTIIGKVKKNWWYWRFWSARKWSTRWFKCRWRRRLRILSIFKEWGVNSINTRHISMENNRNWCTTWILLAAKDRSNKW